MENEIKVNEYIRTKRGVIDRVVKISDNYIFLKTTFFITEYGESSTFIKKTDVVKHSPKPIDIVQCGDYVNGEIIDQIENDRNPKLIWHLSAYGDEDIAFKNEDIETIVTKEMMESISYKVERKD